jgi:methyl-accepting chemotaxis protein
MATRKKAVAEVKSKVKKKVRKSTTKTKPVAVKAVPRVKERRTVKRGSYKSPLGLDVQTLEATFNILKPQAGTLVHQFYNQLFRRYPQVKPLFKNTSRAKQEKKFVAALQLVVRNLRKPKVLVNTLRSLGAKHQAYGVEPEHYAAVASTLLDVMAEFTGDLWTDKVHEAWSGALETVAATMLTAYDNSEKNEMAASKKAVQEKLGNNVELTRLKAAIEGSMTAVIMVDLDFNISFFNDATKKLLSKHRVALAAVFPGFNPDNLMGSCIDQFHKNPAHQRQLLADPNNLPWVTDIAIGDLKFQLNVTGQWDSNSKLIGYTLEWSEVTQLREKEDHATRLQGAIDNSMQANIMVDRDFIITYANDATNKLLSKHKDALVSVFPGFDPDKLIGSCIDMFHKNPAHQRKLLEDPKNLPFQTDISIAHLQFALNVTATMDNDGNYVGNSLEWSDVTELRERESNVARLQGTINGAMTAMMMVDRDLVITYANESTLNLLRKHETALRSVYPGFSADKVVGACIDTFHVNPAHQRRLLDDPINLPHQADINIGDLKFSLNVTAIMDAEGNYVGNALEWFDVTEARQ